MTTDSPRSLSSSTAPAGASPAWADWFQLDVFTDRAGGGNPLGVVLGASDWSTGEMQRLAAWTDLVETTFVLPPSDDRADYRVRIFTPSREIPFAGHPSLGTAHAVLESGLVPADAGQLTQECGAGLLRIAIEHDGGKRRLFVEAPPAQVVEAGEDSQRQLRALLSQLAPGMLAPVLVSGGRKWWLAEVDGEAALRAWQPDHRAIAELALATDSLGLCLFARSQCPHYELAVRAFPCAIGIDEDPASGAANSLLAHYLRHAQPDGPLAHGYRVSQGRELGRDALLELRIDDAGGIQVGGQVQTVIRGQIAWPRDS